MTQEEILEYNKLCAEFLGMDNDAFLLAKQIEKNTGICHLKFHSDWNWIMEVVEAIEKLPDLYGRKNCRYVINITTDALVDNKHTISIDHSVSKNKGFTQERKVTVYRKDSKKEAVVQAINQFLIWYEQNKII